MIDLVPLGFLTNFDFREIIRDLDVEAKLECKRFQASRAVVAEETRGCIEFEQLPSRALKIIWSLQNHGR